MGWEARIASGSITTGSILSVSETATIAGHAPKPLEANAWLPLVLPNGNAIMKAWVLSVSGHEAVIELGRDTWLMSRDPMIAADMFPQDWAIQGAR